MRPPTPVKRRSLRALASALGLSALLGMTAGHADAATLFVTNEPAFSNGTGSISKIDTGGNVTTLVAAGPLNVPGGIKFNSAGVMIVSNVLNKGTTSDLIRVDPVTGAISPYAVNNDFTLGFAIDAADNIYTANVFGNNVTKLTGPFPGNTLATYAGPDGTLLNIPVDIAINAAGDQFVVSFNYAGVAKIHNGVVTNYASGVLFNQPDGLAFDAAGNLFVANAGNGKILRIAASDQTITTFATGLNAPGGLAFDSGLLYVADAGSNTIQRINSEGGVSTFATGLSSPSFLAFQPQTQDIIIGIPAPAALPAGLMLMGIVGFVRRRGR